MSSSGRTRDWTPCGTQRDGRLGSGRAATHGRADRPVPRVWVSVGLGVRVCVDQDPRRARAGGCVTVSGVSGGPTGASHTVPSGPSSGFPPTPAQVTECRQSSGSRGPVQTEKSKPLSCRHARKHFSQAEGSQLDEVRQVMGMLAFPPDTHISPYKVTRREPQPFPSAFAPWSAGRGSPSLSPSRLHCAAAPVCSVPRRPGGCGGDGGGGGHCSSGRGHEL